MRSTDPLLGAQENPGQVFCKGVKGELRSPVINNCGHTGAPPLRPLLFSTGKGEDGLWSESDRWLPWRLVSDGGCRCCLSSSGVGLGDGAGIRGEESPGALPCV